MNTAPISEEKQTKPYYRYDLALIPLGIAINLVIGTIVNWLKLPIYLDAVGTILVTLILGWKQGAITGILSFILGGLLVNPVLPYFSGTQLAIAIYVYIVARNGGYKNVWLTVISGIGLGIVAGVVSAPVITYLFGGITGNGTSLIAGYLLATGKNIWQSVIISGLTSEPVDKALQSLLAFWLLHSVPNSILIRFNSKLLQINKFIK